MNTFTIKFDWKVISALLLVIILAMFGIWRPWQTATTTKTISVSGTATVKALPDEFVFSPSYEQKANTEKEALTAVTDLSTTITSKLKDLGVADKDIQSSASTDGGMMYPYWQWNPTTKTARASLTITVNNKDLAGKVQAYLLTTDLTGSATPQAQFSDQRRKDLEAQGRTKATADAKQKADQAASELGVKVGKAQQINLSNNFGEVIPMMGKAVALDSSTSAPSASPSTAIYTGQQDVTVTVTVVYGLK